MQWFNGIRTQDLPAWSISPQPSTLKRAPSPSLQMKDIMILKQPTINSFQVPAVDKPPSYSLQHSPCRRNVTKEESDEILHAAPFTSFLLLHKHSSHSLASASLSTYTIHLSFDKLLIRKLIMITSKHKLTKKFWEEKNLLSFTTVLIFGKIWRKKPPYLCAIR
jgi:hypothetical protein